MFTDKKRAKVYNQIRRRDQAIFEHILTPELFFQAARLSELPLVLCPLNLINLVWLAVCAAPNPKLCFANIPRMSLKTLQDHQSFSRSALGQLLTQPSQPANKEPRHDPRKGAAEPVSEAAFCKARQSMPSEFWVALFLLLAEQFQRLYSAVIRFRRFRLMAIDGTELELPDWPDLREHFGTANNSVGSHGAQARLTLLQFPPGSATLRPCAGAAGSRRDQHGPAVTAGAVCRRAGPARRRVLVLRLVLAGAEPTGALLRAVAQEPEPACHQGVKCDYRGQ
jgi:hypothetical protein